MSFENQPEIENLEALRAYLQKRGLDIEQISSGDSEYLMNLRGPIYRWVGEDEVRQSVAEPYLERIARRLEDIEASQNQQRDEQITQNKLELEKYGGALNWITHVLGVDKQYLKQTYSQSRLDDPVTQSGIVNEANILFRKFGKQMGLTDLELRLSNSSRLGFELDQLVEEIRGYISS